MSANGSWLVLVPLFSTEGGPIHEASYFWRRTGPDECDWSIFTTSTHVVPNGQPYVLWFNSHLKCLYISKAYGLHLRYKHSHQSEGAVKFRT